jgi:nucleotide-binding universal stress UspA family protein
LLKLGLIPNPEHSYAAGATILEESLNSVVCDYSAIPYLIHTLLYPSTYRLVFKAVLIALGNSPLDQQVIQTVGQLHLAANTHVVLLHVVPYVDDMAVQDASRPLPPEADFPHQQLEQYLRDYGTQLTSAPPTIELVQGDPENEIIRVANIHQVDLIVLGSRGLTGLNRIIAGSVSSRVLEAAPCTVMVVKPSA